MGKVGDKGVGKIGVVVDMLWKCSFLFLSED